MNKKLLAAAVAAAVVAAPAAFADNVVYGKFHTSIDMVDADDEQDNWQMDSRASRLGFKGSEDLGNGLKAIYQIELGFNADGGGTGQVGGSSGLGGSSRNTFVGLAGGFGTFLVGRHDTPMKVAFYAAGNERLGDSAIDLNLSSSLTPSKSGLSPIGVFSEYRANDAIAYVSPNLSGFSAAVAVIPGEDDGVTPGNGGRDGLADHYSLGLMYKGGGLRASGGYQMTDPGTGAGVDKQKTLQLGGSYAFGAFSVGAQYEDTDNFAFVDGDEYTAWALTGKATFGNNAISLVYTDSELDVDGGSSIDTRGWGIAAEHNFSKRTQVYAAYAADSRDNYQADGSDQDVDMFSIGLVHSF
jgi:predicted porin